MSSTKFNLENYNVVINTITAVSTLVISGNVSVTGVLTQSGFSLPEGDTYGNYLYWDNTEFVVGSTTVSIGSNAGEISQGVSAVAIGNQAGQTTQGQNAIAMGLNAGRVSQGTSAIAMGAFAGETTQTANSIIINAQGTALNANNSGLFVAPIREQSFTNILTYDTTTKEIGNIVFDQYWNKDGSNIYYTDGNVGIRTTSPNASLHIVAETILDEFEPPEDAAFVWVTRNSATLNLWQSVAWAPEIDNGEGGNGLLVAVTSTGSQDRVMTSPDGITWTSRLTPGFPGNHARLSVVWAPEVPNGLGGFGLFVSLSSSGSGFSSMVSPDGINWSISSTDGPIDGWQSIVWATEIDNGEGGNGLFVAVSNGGRVITSPDGTNWTTRTPSASNIGWRSITWAPEIPNGNGGNGLLVAVAGSGNISQRIMTSPDGVNWTSGTDTSQDNIFDMFWTSVIWAKELGLLIAVAGSASGATESNENFSGAAPRRVMTSPDGVNWTLRNTPVTPNSSSWRSVVWSKELGTLVAVAGVPLSGNDGGRRIMTSPDGINWTALLTFSTINEWNSVIWAPELRIFVAVAGRQDSNFQPQVLTTVPYEIPSPPPTPPLAILGEAPLPEPSGSAPVYLSRAWVNFNGTTGSIRSSGNVSSVVRTDVGDYTINFETPMPDTNYSFVFGGARNSDGGECYFGVCDDVITTSSLRVKTWSGAVETPIATDLTHFSLIISR